MALDFFKHNYEEKESEFEDIVACFDNCYQSERTKLTPLFIQKHFGKNINKKNKVYAHDIIIIPFSD